MLRKGCGYAWMIAAAVVCVALLLWVFGLEPQKITPFGRTAAESTVAMALLLLLLDRLVGRGRT